MYVFIFVHCLFAVIFISTYGSIMLSLIHTLIKLFVNDSVFNVIVCH